MRARTVLTGAVLFALAMATLTYGDWWWAWLVGGMVVLASGRMRFLGTTGNRHIIRQNHKTRRANRKIMRQRERTNRQKSRNSKRMPRFPL